MSTTVYFSNCLFSPASHLHFNFNSLLKWLAFCPSIPEQSKYTSGTIPLLFLNHICSKPSQYTSTAHNVYLPCPLFFFFFKYVCIRRDCCGHLGQLGIPQCISTWPATAVMAGSAYFRVCMLKWVLQNFPSLRENAHISEHTWQYTY